MKECSHCHQEIAEPLTYRTAPNLGMFPKYSKRFKLPIDVKIYIKISFKTLGILSLSVLLGSEFYGMGLLSIYLLNPPPAADLFMCGLLGSIIGNVCLFVVGYIIYKGFCEYVHWVKKEIKQYKSELQLESPKDLTVAQLFENEWREEQLNKKRFIL